MSPFGLSSRPARHPWQSSCLRPNWAQPVDRGRLLSALGTLLLITVLATSRPTLAAEPGQPLSVSSVPDSEGRPLALFDGKAKLTYVDFWASWCGPCRQSFPWMNRMQSRYGAQGLRVVAVNLDSKLADAQAFLKEVPAQVQLGFDPKGESARRVGIRAMPSSVLLGPDGRVLWQHSGFREEEAQALEARIAAALKTP